MTKTKSAAIAVPDTYTLPVCDGVHMTKLGTSGFDSALSLATGTVLVWALHQFVTRGTGRRHGQHCCPTQPCNPTNSASMLSPGTCGRNSFTMMYLADLQGNVKAYVTLQHAVSITWSHGIPSYHNDKCTNKKFARFLKCNSGKQELYLGILGLTQAE